MISKATPKSLLITICFLLIGLAVKLTATQPPAVSPLSLSGNITGVAIEKLRAHSEWRTFLEKYASPSPLLALNKTTDPKLATTDAQIEQILRGDTLIKFNEPLLSGGKELKEVDVLIFDEARRFNPIDSVDSVRDFGSNALVASKEETRFNVMLEDVQKHISHRKSDELLIVHLGATHALDLFFSFFLQDPNRFRQSPLQQRRQEIWYVGMPITLETSFHSPEYYELLKVKDGVASPEVKIKELGAGMKVFYLSRLAYFNGLRQGVIKTPDLKSEKATSLGTIVFMDIHQVNSKAHYDELPSAEALKRVGFQRVKIALEGYVRDKAFPLSVLEWHFRSPHVPFLWDYEMDFLKKKSKSMLTRYMNGEIIWDMGIAAFYQKLKSYEAAGLPVTLVGIEEFDVYKAFDATARNSLDPANR